MNVAVVGFATEGKVSAAYFARQGHQVTVCDQDETLEIPETYATQLGEHYLHNLDRFDIIVRTAGIHPRVILDQNPAVAGKITTAVDAFFSHCPTVNIIGITGTKGKGTTSTLTAKMLEAAGHTVWLGGNIGRSPLEFIDDIQPKDWVVLELSSFQLIDLTHSPHIAVCLMVVPEHLNWHADLEEYITAKSQLFIHQGESDHALYFAPNDLSRRIAASGKSEVHEYYTPPLAHVEGSQVVVEGQVVCDTAEIRLLGAHNWQNACAAISAVWLAGARDLDAVRSVLTTFTGLEHRLELVREVDGVKYYDDSFGTTPETAVVALQAFKEPKVVVLGGSSKGADFSELARVVSENNVRHAVLIGEEAGKIAAALADAGFKAYSNGPTTMPEMVETLRSLAQPGDVALLSTGCASFGLFHDYKDRGNQFKAAVKALV